VEDPFLVQWFKQTNHPKRIVLVPSIAGIHLPAIVCLLLIFVKHKMTFRVTILIFVFFSKLSDSGYVYQGDKGKEAHAVQPFYSPIHVLL